MSSIKRSSERPTWLLVVPWELHHVGGVNQVVVGLYRQLIETNRYRPLILILDWQAASPKRKRYRQYETVHFRLRSAPRTPLDILRWLFYGPFELFQLQKLLREENVRVVNVHYPGYATFPFVVLKRLALFRGSLLLSFHGLDLQAAAKATGLGGVAWRFFVRGADAASACSQALAEDAKSVFGAESKKIRAVHNGVDIDPDSEFRRTSRQDLALPECYLLNVATYERKKGQDILIRAFASISQDYPEYHLVLAGRDDGLKSELLELCRKLKVTDRVAMFDALPHEVTIELFRNARAFVLPSRSEPFGLVVLEAGMMGLPVVATRVGGIPEIIVSSNHGTLVQPDDAVALAAAIREVIDDPDRAEQKGRLLQARVRQCFSWRRACDQLESLAR